MEPTPHLEPTTTKPNVHWLKRGLVALIREHRLPYQVSVVLDKVCNSIGLHIKTIEANGFKVKVRRRTSDELFVQNIIVNKEYTPPGFEIHESDIVIDIGGNIGTFALLASRYASRGKVFTFEPNSENYKLLVQNILPIHAAVSGSIGKIKLFRGSDGGFHSIHEDRAYNHERYELVDSVNLKDIFEVHSIVRCDFLKLDCEGAEHDILYSLPKEYYSRINKIAME